MIQLSSVAASFLPDHDVCRPPEWLCLLLPLTTNQPLLDQRWLSSILQSCLVPQSLFCLSGAIPAPSNINTYLSSRSQLYHPFRSLCWLSQSKSVLWWESAVALAHPVLCPCLLCNCLTLSFCQLLSSSRAGLHLPSLPPYLWYLAGHWEVFMNGWREGIHLEISYRRPDER